jgi:hypothetical protein
MVDPRLSRPGESGIAEVLAAYEAKGFTAGFVPRAGGNVMCTACRDVSPAEQVPVEAMHRFEGASDPEDEAILIGAECPSCGEWGTVVLSYGPNGSAEDGEVLRRLMDDRRHSVIQPGQ